MKTVIAGGSGFIGRAVVDLLGSRGDVVVLSRSNASVRNARSVVWAPPAVGEWARELDDADVVVNLAGASIGEGRWTDARKRELLTSRVNPTRAIVEALQRSVRRERVLVNASAVGIYGDRGDELLDESSAPGTGFLADLARAWESEALRAKDVARVAIVRFGVVLDSDGGMLQKLRLPFLLGGAAVLGTGEQWMSWISRRDAVRLLEWVIATPAATGIFNATSPHPVTNREFTRAYAASLRRPALFRAPKWPLRLALGEMADALLFASQRAVPARGEREGFTFEDPTLDRALAASRTAA